MANGSAPFQALSEPLATTRSPMNEMVEFWFPREHVPWAELRSPGWRCPYKQRTRIYDMKRIIAVVATVAGAAVSSPSFAQTSQPSTKNEVPSPSTSTQPESMRIQQRTQRQYFNAPVSPNTSGTTTEAPGAASSPVEQGRIDPAAPSRNRLQIDEGQSARARENPDTNAQQSGSGTSYNTMIRGAPSSSGTGAGTGVSGSTGAGSSGTSGAGGAASSGSSAGGSSGGSH